MVSRKEGITPEVITEVRAALAAAPANRSRSKAKAVAELIDEIRAARALGYSFAEIADLMSAHGLQIKPSTLKGYLSAAKSKADSGDPKKAGDARVASGKVKPLKPAAGLKSGHKPPESEINKSAATVSSVTSHSPLPQVRRNPPNPFLEADRRDK